MIYIPDVLLTIFYACFGIILMLTANTVIDFFVPGKFSEEIKRGNCAVRGFQRDHLSVSVKFCALLLCHQP